MPETDSLTSAAGLHKQLLGSTSAVADLVDAIGQMEGSPRPHVRTIVAGPPDRRGGARADVGLVGDPRLRRRRYAEQFRNSVGHAVAGGGRRSGTLTHG